MNNCEHCNQLKSLTTDVVFYERYKMTLCDRCVDKFDAHNNSGDADEFWKDEDAIRCGYNSFPKKPIPNKSIY